MAIGFIHRDSRKVCPILACHSKVHGVPSQTTSVIQSKFPLQNKDPCCCFWWWGDDYEVFIPNWALTSPNRRLLQSIGLSVFECISDLGATMSFNAKKPESASPASYSSIHAFLGQPSNSQRVSMAQAAGNPNGSASTFSPCFQCCLPGGFLVCQAADTGDEGDEGFSGWG